MVLIAGLIGIGLAIEAAERRHVNKNVAKKNNSEEGQGSHHGAYILYLRGPS
jgi:hypothetical protein